MLSLLCFVSTVWKGHHLKQEVTRAVSMHNSASPCQQVHKSLWRAWKFVFQFTIIYSFWLEEGAQLNACLINNSGFHKVIQARKQGFGVCQIHAGAGCSECITLMWLSGNCGYLSWVSMYTGFDNLLRIWRFWDYLKAGSGHGVECFYVFYYIDGSKEQALWCGSLLLYSSHGG